MARQVARLAKKEDASAVIRHLHKLVTNGPRNLDVANAMSAYGYDAVKWAEGQGVLAELVSCDLPRKSSVAAAIQWYNEAAIAAQSALDAKPQLLAKLGVTEVGTG